MGCMLAGSSQDSVRESFLLEQAPVQKTIKKKKQTLSALRNECAELCEDYAHVLVKELAVASRIMFRLPDAHHQKILELFCSRYTSLDEAAQFFVSGKKRDVQQAIDKIGNVSDAAWKMVGTIARLQGVLLTGIRQLLEQDEAHFCMRATKQQLKEYIEVMGKMVDESKLFVENLELLYLKKELESKRM